MEPSTEMGGGPCKLWVHSVRREQIVAIRGCLGWGLLGPLGVRPGSGPTVRGCLLQGLPCSSSTRSKLSVNSGVPQNRGVPAGRDTYTDPVPAADSRGSPSSAPCPHPGSPAPPPMAAGDGSWPAPLWTHPPRADTHGWPAASPLRSARPGQLSQPGRTSDSRKAPPRALSCLPQRRSVRRRPLPRRTGQAGGSPRGNGPRTPSPPWELPQSHGPASAVSHPLTPSSQAIPGPRAALNAAGGSCPALASQTLA